MTDLALYAPPSAAELHETWKLAEQLAKTEFVAKPMRGQPEAVLACMLTGRELGIGPMQALRDVYLVNGRPSLAATLMVARVRAAGHRFRTLHNDDERATVQITRRGETEPEPPVTFTLEDARRARLADKDIWKQYPARLCWARAASAACRRDAPEVLGGVVYTPEELSDSATTVTVGDLEVDRATGEAVDGPPGDGISPGPPPGAFRDELAAAQTEGAERRRQFEQAMTTQESGAAMSAAQATDEVPMGEAHRGAAPGRTSPPAEDDAGPRPAGTTRPTTVQLLATQHGVKASVAFERLKAANWPVRSTNSAIPPEDQDSALGIITNSPIPAAGGEA
jgi:hypothetical protein